jgi:hypothetical protein
MRSGLIAVAALVASPAIAAPPVPVIVAPPTVEYATGQEAPGPSDGDRLNASLGARAFSNVVPDVQAYFDRVLPDFPSTRFRDVGFGYRNADRIICGYYNTKNRMGAYSGWAIFYAYTAIDGFHIRILNPGDPGEYTYRWHCGDKTAWMPGDRSAEMTFKP